LHRGGVQRKAQFQTEQLKKKQRELSKEIGKMMKTDKNKAEAMKAEVGEVKKQLEETEKRSEHLGAERDALMATIGNIVHMDIKVANDEDVSTVVGAYGTGPLEYDPTGKLGGTDIRRNTEAKPEKLLNHVDLCHRLDIRDTEEGGGAAEGTKVAGGRAYFLKGHGCMLNQALINYGLVFLAKRGYTPMHCPFFMRQSMMGQCAQLSQFDEELYKVTGEGEDKYLIATSEQALCAFHQGKRVEKASLPTRYAGYSSCFRKEAGSHGRDQLGIFRVHQFEKVEQFVLTSPEGDKSWEMMKQSEPSTSTFSRPFASLACEPANSVTLP
jgi:seryl-tRNA synthetase